MPPIMPMKMSTAPKTSIATNSGMKTPQNVCMVLWYQNAPG
jgi:hypothetical protein